MFCSLAQGFQSLSEFAEHLAVSVDIVFPVIHGQFGEDGGIQVHYYGSSLYKHLYYFFGCFIYLFFMLWTIQELLEKYNVPFVGTGSKECQQAFNKVVKLYFSRHHD